MHFLRYAFVSLISAVLGVLLVLTVQLSSESLTPQHEEAVRLALQNTSPGNYSPALSDQERQELMDGNPIHEINFSYESGWIAHGSYQVTLRRNGEAVYVGESGMERKGRHTTHINPWDFYRLSRLIVESKQFDRPAEFSEPVTDCNTYTITVVRDGKSVEVSDYADAAPFGVWQVERAIVGIVEEALWQVSFKPRAHQDHTN